MSGKSPVKLKKPCAFVTVVVANVVVAACMYHPPTGKSPGVSVPDLSTSLYLNPRMTPCSCGKSYASAVITLPDAVASAPFHAIALTTVSSEIVMGPCGFTPPKTSPHTGSSATSESVVPRVIV